MFTCPSKLALPTAFPFLYEISSCSTSPPAFSSVQFSSVTQLCLTVCDPIDCRTPGLPVHHQLPEPTQGSRLSTHGSHVHHISDAIQPSHPLSSPSPPAPNPSQHQSANFNLTLLIYPLTHFAFCNNKFVFYACEFISML